MRYRLLIAPCIAGIALALPALGAPRAVPVTVAEARMERIVERVEGTGSLQPFAVAELVPKIAGATVMEVPVHAADRVRKGQVLARLDDELVRTQIDRVEAELRATQARIRAADARIAMLEKDVKRAQDLFARGVSPRQQLDHAEAKLRVATAERDAARAQKKALEETLQELRLKLSYHVLTAPWDGTVLARHTDPGDISSTTRPLITLGRLDRLKLRVQVAEADYPRVRPGQPARVRVDAAGSRWIPAGVARVLPGLDPVTHTGQVEIHLDAAGTALRPGMFARARIDVGAHRGVLVPRDALRKIPGSGVWFVYVVTPEGKAQRRDVTLGLSLGPRVEVLSGVKAGEAVITRGEGVVRTGVPVQVVDLTGGK